MFFRRRWVSHEINIWATDSDTSRLPSKIDSLRMQTRGIKFEPTDPHTDRTKAIFANDVVLHAFFIYILSAQSGMSFDATNLELGVIRNDRGEIKRPAHY